MYSQYYKSKMGRKTLLQKPDYAEFWFNFWRIAAIDATNNPWPALLLLSKVVIIE